jgi:SAM-dependent methyltransferase
MDLIELVRRQAVPLPWAEGEKIPWDDPAFSQRMLKEHLSQSHDHASRRTEILSKHVTWIHHSILNGKPAKILDLGCGPGLYASLLAELGHECVGIDFSPASIAYAIEYAHAHKLKCSYIQQDVRLADFGHGFDLVMFIFGELNAFRPAEARLILQNAYQALVQGGRILLEVHPYDVVRSIGEQPAYWYSAESGLFSDRAYICLREYFWDPEQHVATERYFIIDAESSSVTRYASSMQAYSDDQYRALLQECGFRDVQFHPSLHGEPDESQASLFVIAARK